MARSHARAARTRGCDRTLVRSLRNDDGNGNEYRNKPIRLDSQNFDFAGTSRFFANFFAVVARLQLFFSPWTLIQSFQSNSTPKKFANI